MTRPHSPCSWLIALVLVLACGGGTSNVDGGTTPPDAGTGLDGGDDAGMADAGAHCVDECPLDALMCNGNDSESCGPGANGCLQWNVTVCAVGQQCTDGECMDICENTCGTSCCTASQVCMLGMCCDNPCGDQCCTTDEVCDNGVCGNSCANPCGGSCCGASQSCVNGSCCTPCGSSCCGGAQTCGTDSSGNPMCVNACLGCN